MTRTCRQREAKAGDFLIESDSPVEVRVVTIAGPTITKERIDRVEPRRGNLPADPDGDRLKMAVINKQSSGLEMGLGFVAGVGLVDGAVATSLIWDTNNVLCIGADERDLAAVANEVRRMGGGISVAVRGEIKARLPLPIGGVISQEPIEVINGQAAEVRRVLADLGCELERPILTFQTLCFTGLPFLRLTDKGLVDVRRRELVNLIV